MNFAACTWAESFRGFAPLPTSAPVAVSSDSSTFTSVIYSNDSYHDPCFFCRVWLFFFFFRSGDLNFHGFLLFFSTLFFVVQCISNWPVKTFLWLNDVSWETSWSQMHGDVAQSGVGWNLSRDGLPAGRDCEDEKIYSTFGKYIRRMVMYKVCYIFLREMKSYFTRGSQCALKCTFG